ncbi:hypothetical protein ACT29H_15990 [Thermophagus sp. OGC60D27]|uniref:hypothetical protein n=1 Tax=Thermophagus sp. OGC60D27 TaxID=3458415 RepID=UPI004037BBC4
MSQIEIGNSYAKFLDSFLNVENIDDLNSSKNEISKSIYKQIFKIKVAQWKYKVKFKRRRNMAISDLFQDIVAFYISRSLGSDFEVIIEEKIGKLQPDILIKYKNKNIFILEIKTTIGWDRRMHEKGGNMEKRIKKLSEAAGIPEDNIVYIFMSPWNVNKKFAAKYWDLQEDRPKELPKEFPYNKIRPLLTNDDPFYWKQNRNSRYEDFKEFSDQEIDNYAKKGIVIPLELTINEIKTAASKCNFIHPK